MAKKKSPQASRQKQTAIPKRAVKPVPKSPAKKAPKTRQRSARKKPLEPTLGRPKVTGEEQLYMLFHEDYHARQIFDFLRVQTVKELEQYSPQQIVKLLSKPITETVNRVRRKLAEKNRHLQDDLNFAIDLQDQAKE